MMLAMCSERSQAPISRRSFLRAASLTLATGGALGRIRAAASTSPSSTLKPFRFLVINDLHHATPECTPFFEALVAHMRRQAPYAFCLVVGDLADTGLNESLIAMRDSFARLEVPIHPVPGNHDCDVGENTDVYNQAFPEKLNYTFTHGGWQFVGLDSTDGNQWHDTHIGNEALAFLDQNLPLLDPQAPTVLFTHFPLAADVRMAPLNTAEVLNRFSGLNLRCAFSGHFHARTERECGDAVLLTNTCCSRVRGPHDGTIAEGYLVCTAHPDGSLEREFVEYLPAESTTANGA